MEKEEPFTTIPAIETFKTFDCSLEQPIISFTDRPIRIGVVSEEAEDQVRFFVGQVPDFQPFHLCPD